MECVAPLLCESKCRGASTERKRFLSRQLVVSFVGVSRLKHDAHFWYRRSLVASRVRLIRLSKLASLSCWWIVEIDFWLVVTKGLMNIYSLYIQRASTQGWQFDFLKPNFEILTFFNALVFFLKIKEKARENLFFSVGKFWLWQSIVRAAYSLQIPPDESLWQFRMQRILQRSYCCPKNSRCVS